MSLFHILSIVALCWAGGLAAMIGALMAADWYATMYPPERSIPSPEMANAMVYGTQHARGGVYDQERVSA